MTDTQKTRLKTLTHFTQSGNINTSCDININRTYFGQVTTQKSYFTTVDYGLQGCDSMWFCVYVPECRKDHLLPSTLKMEAAGSSVTLVHIYQTIWGHILHDHNICIHRHENLKSQKSLVH